MEVSTRPRRSQREARYRGYDIVMQRRDLCWMVTMKPSRSELPVFQRYSLILDHLSVSLGERRATAETSGCYVRMLLWSEQRMSEPITKAAGTHISAEQERR
jgi:hypothetical protein